MDWLALVIAGLFEVVWAVMLKYTQGFTKLVPSLITGSAMLASILLLSRALRTIPIGTGYAVWTGIGACGTLLIGMWFLGESKDPIRVACIGVIIACMVILKITHK
ncbi:MAG TPA: SMR family transporter [Chlamydiales bacterium]|jgi:quaternary ammonium compound-resistance protein SugE|nr:SMR family transporter [Chlamydiales bacterium]